MRISDWSSDVCSSDLVSMDSLTVDIGALAENDLAERDFVELLGPSQWLAGVARDAGTIAYELLTRLGARHPRIHVDRKRVVQGKSVSVRVDHGGLSSLKQKKQQIRSIQNYGISYK